MLSVSVTEDSLSTSSTISFDSALKGLDVGIDVNDFTGFGVASLNVVRCVG